MKVVFLELAPVLIDVVIKDCYSPGHGSRLIRSGRCRILGHLSLGRLGRVKHLCRSIWSVGGVIAAVVVNAAAATAAAG